MSKVGRKPINISDVQVSIQGQTVSYKGANNEGSYVLPDCLRVTQKENTLRIELADAKDTKNYNFWGLHRALLANEISGAKKDFSTEVVIVGLGYKGEVKGDTIVFSLGYSHKIDFKIPEGVKVATDKSGQKLTVSSASKFMVGDVAQRICALKKPEPYKGTGIRLQHQQIHRKAGKN